MFGGPTNGRANACRRRLAAVELDKAPVPEGETPPGSEYQPSFPPRLLQFFCCCLVIASHSLGPTRLLVPVISRLAGPSAPIISSILIHIFRQNRDTTGIKKITQPTWQPQRQLLRELPE